MKKLSILVLTATVVTAPAFAETTVYQTIPSTAPSVELSTQPTQEADLSFAFEDTQNLQAVAMTDKEMAETEGAWVPYAVGGAIGGISYISGCAYTKCTAAGLGKSVVGGALVPVRGAQVRYGASKVAFAGGIINGAGNRKGWW
ncbi:hypothetical protein AAX09_00330 [Moraxella bovoculi]|uniref:hypothetical protein n=1 Tax=Moraxella bovoculi TaxID=386891 RepID=UPI00062491CC|nr:hypothetical protein [Moraxella bovoculi]AKG18120.1 hypothetical protein AAX09_00330 [Moraxella bovoculi]NSM11205.1 hypothetical protein [Moraxella bovoculi]